MKCLKDMHVKVQLFIMSHKISNIYLLPLSEIILACKRRNPYPEIKWNDS